MAGVRSRIDQFEHIQKLSRSTSDLYNGSQQGDQQMRRSTSVDRDTKARLKIYDEAASNIRSSLSIFEFNLDKMVRKQIAAKPAKVQKQLGDLKDLSEKVVDEMQDFERRGASLGDVTDVMRYHIDTTNTEIHERYNDLRGKIDERLSALQSALARLQSVRNNLEDHLDIDGQGLDKSTVKAKREQYEQRKVSGASREQGHQLSNQVDKLGDFEQALDKLEDWLLPKIARLESKEFMVQGLYKISEENKKCQEEIGHYRPQYKIIKENADRLLRQHDATDVPKVKNMLNNCKVLWKTLKNLITKRGKQLKDLQTVTEEYQAHRNDVLYWMDNMEHRLDKVQPETVDTKELRVIKKKIAYYKPNIDANCKNGEALDTLTGNIVRTLRSVPYYRSTELDNISDQGQAQDTFQEPEELDNTMSVQRDVCDVSARYEVLKIRAATTLENLELSKEWVNHLKNVDSYQEWVTASDTKIEGARPVSNDIHTLTKEIEDLRVINSEIQSQQAKIWDMVNESEHFLHTNHDRLTSRQYGDLSTKATNLRKHLYDIFIRSEEWLKEGTDRLKMLQMDSEQKVERKLFKEKIRAKETEIEGLQDWLAKAEQDLASQQPLTEKSLQVKQQHDSHQVLHEDIHTHLQLKRQCMEDIEQLLKTRGDRVEFDESKHLRDKQFELRERFDFVLMHSSYRQKTLKRAIEDLKKLEFDFTEFQDWIQDAERKMDATEGNIAIELMALKAQLAKHIEFGEDVFDQESKIKFLNESGRAFIDLAKNYRQKLAEFCRTVNHAREDSHVFKGTSETHLLTRQLEDVNNRLDSLKRHYDKQLRYFNELVAKHQTYEDSVNHVSQWLGTAKTTVDKMKKERVVGTKETTPRQMERAETFKQDINAYARDVEDVKTNGQDLINSQPALKQNVQRKTGDIVECYHTIEIGVDHVLERLQVAKTVMENFDVIREWLDEAEKKQHRLENESLSMTRTAIIAEQVENSREEISAHKSDISDINDVANQLIQTSEPEEARKIRDWLCEINDRYQKVSNATSQYIEVLRRVNDFENSVDILEEWELPLIQTLSARKMRQQQLEMPQLIETLKDIRQQIERQRTGLEEVLQIGKQLLKELRVNNTSHVNGILDNVNVNWKTLEDSVAERMTQVDDLQASIQMYDSQHKDITIWLDGMQDKVNRSAPNITERTTILASLEEIESLMKEVKVYEPNITTLNCAGNSLNTLKLSLVQSLPSKPIYRHSQLHLLPVPALRFELEPRVDGKSEVCSAVKHELEYVNQSYEDLSKCLDNHIDVLHRAKCFHEEIDYAQQTLDWMETTQVRHDLCKPNDQEIEPHRKEIEALKILRDDVTTKQRDITCSMEKFKRDFCGRLTSEKLKPLEEKVDRLTALYDKVSNYSNDWLRRHKPETPYSLRKEKTMVREIQSVPTTLSPRIQQSIVARLQGYGAHAKKRKWTIFRMAATAIVFITALSLASERTQHHFEAGAQGTVTFDAPWTARDGLIVFFNVRFESEKHPFCTLTNRLPEGFKSASQYDRFRISYTITDKAVRVTVDISDISEEDADVYILTLISIDADNGKTVLLEKEVGVHQPLGSARCDVHESTDGYDTRYAEVSCRAVAGRGSPMLACYQHGVKVPYKGQVHNDGRHVDGTFWMKLNSSPIYCCSYDEGATVDQSTCRDFVWPPQALTTGKSLVTLSRTLSISKINSVQDYPKETADSGRSLHAQLMFVYLFMGTLVYLATS
ncbi:uncharacterized protein [Diadema antillarum]|uniref:uncharacterized protein n=1 Tax=Diadema antillarum TaxID=105358 RepID=UPI003A8BFC91